jgi:hypothetical protein
LFREAFRVLKPGATNRLTTSSSSTFTQGTSSRPLPNPTFAARSSFGRDWALRSR